MISSWDIFLSGLCDQAFLAHSQTRHEHIFQGHRNVSPGLACFLQLSIPCEAWAAVSVCSLLQTKIPFSHFRGGSGDCGQLFPKTVSGAASAVALPFTSYQACNFSFRSPRIFHNPALLVQPLETNEK